MALKRIEFARPTDAWGFSSAIGPEFAPMIEQLAQQARQSPAAYARRVLMAAALGYLALAGWLLLLLFGLWIATWIMWREAISLGAIILAMAALGNIWLTLRALFVPHPAPDGLVLARGDAPALFDMVEAVRRDVGGPKIHDLRLSEEFNAGIVQQPRLGPLGWHRNHLVVGLPLMQGLPEDELKAVIAHEFGHLANADGKLAVWVYRVRQTWAQVADNLENSGWAKLLQLFFRWYGPWFNAISFGLARETEFAADAVASRATSPETAGRTLVRVSLTARRHDQDYWRDVHEGWMEGAGETMTPFADSAPFLRSPWDAQVAAAALERALETQTGLADTHPALRERLRALGAAPVVPAPFENSAADTLLPAQGRNLAASLDRHWWEQTEGHWHGLREERVQAGARLAELEAQAVSGPLTREALAERAELTEYLHGPGAAAAIYDLLARREADPVASAAAARCRLQGGDIAALEDVLHHACRAGLEPSTRCDIAGMALDWIDRHAPGHPLTGRFRELEAEMAQLAAALATELDSFDETNDVIELPGNDGLRRALQDVGAGDRGIRKIWVAASPSRVAPDHLRMITMFEDDNVLMTAEVGARVDTLLKAMTWHGAGMVVRSQREHLWLRRRIELLPQTLVYSADW